MYKKPLFLCLLAALIFQGRLTSMRACQYCRLAATDPEAARMASQMHSGTFPLDSVINQFQPTTPPAVAPPIRKLPPPLSSPSTPVVADRRTDRWANAGLLGLMGLLGFFGWRTRRVAGPVH